MSTSLQPIIFCDFDGTITENDNIVEIMRHFNPPGWEETVERIVQQKLSIREGVRHMFNLFPASKRDEIIRYALEHAVIREGFSTFLDYIHEHEILFLVTSGGIDFFIFELLSPFPIKNSQIFCNQSDFTGTTIDILFPYPCDDQCDNDCGMCKTRIIRSYPKDQYYRIVIGDSITDFEASKLADKVFARSHLIEQCEKLDIPYQSFTTFNDIIEQLKELEK